MRVPFNLSTYTKCLCPVCPVQKKSECLSAREGYWREARITAGRILEEYPDHPETYEMEAADLEKHEVGARHGYVQPPPEALRELYCAVGRADCRDLDDDKMCICGDCAVHETLRLGRTFYCLTGSSAEVEGE